jgi:hypothetical protein
VPKGYDEAVDRLAVPLVLLQHLHFQGTATHMMPD